MRWKAVELVDAVAFAVPNWAAVEYFKATHNVKPLLAVASASCAWRRCLAWLFFAPD